MPLVDARNRRHDLAGCAVSALEGVMFDDACWTAWSVPSAAASPSIVVTVLPFA